MNDNQSRQQLPSDELSSSKLPRNNKPTSIKIREHDRSQVNNRSKPMRIQQTIENKSTNNKPSSARQPQSPIQLMKVIEPPAQESIPYKPQQQQQQRTKTSDHNKQRYQTSNINTSSIPPLMSVRSDATTTANLYQTMPSDYYEDDSTYYNSNIQSHQRYHPSNAHNRGYTTLGSYGRYRRGGTIRHQQQQQHQYPTYNLNRTSGVSSAPTANTGARQKKNSTNKKSHTSSEQTKTTEIDEVHSPVVKTPPIMEERKLPETPVLSPTIELEKSNGTSDSKTAIKPNALLTPSENDSPKPTDKTPSSTSTNSKQRTNKNSHDQRYQNQQGSSRHRNDYPRAMQGNPPSLSLSPN